MLSSAQNKMSLKFIKFIMYILLALSFSCSIFGTEIQIGPSINISISYFIHAINQENVTKLLLPILLIQIVILHYND